MDYDESETDLQPLVYLLNTPNLYKGTHGT